MPVQITEGVRCDYADIFDNASAVAVWDKARWKLRERRYRGW